MKALIENTKYITLIAVFALLITAVMAFAWASVKTYKVIVLVIASKGADAGISADLIQVIDAFLVAIAIYVLAVSVYELFIGALDMPNGLLAHNYHELKVRLSGLIILVAAVYFVEKLIEGTTGLDLLYLGGAITLISVAMVAFAYVGNQHE